MPDIVLDTVSKIGRSMYMTDLKSEEGLHGVRLDVAYIDTFTS